MENLFMHIFERRDWIKGQLRQQVESYKHSLVSNLLLEGCRPPTWLWDAGPVSEMNREQLISGFLFPPPMVTTPFVSEGPSFHQSSTLCTGISNSKTTERSQNADTYHFPRLDKKRKNSSSNLRQRMTCISEENQEEGLETSNIMLQTGRITRSMSAKQKADCASSSENKNFICVDNGFSGRTTSCISQKFNSSDESTRQADHHSKVMTESAAMVAYSSLDMLGCIQRSRSRQKEIENRLCVDGKTLLNPTNVSNANACIDGMVFDSNHVDVKRGSGLESQLRLKNVVVKASDARSRSLKLILGSVSPKSPKYGVEALLLSFSFEGQQQKSSQNADFSNNFCTNNSLVEGNVSNLSENPLVEREQLLFDVVEDSFHDKSPATSKSVDSSYSKQGPDVMQDGVEVLEKHYFFEHRPQENSQNDDSSNHFCTTNSLVEPNVGTCCLSGMNSVDETEQVLFDAIEDSFHSNCPANFQCDGSSYSKDGPDIMHIFDHVIRAGELMDDVANEAIVVKQHDVVDLEHNSQSLLSDSSLRGPQLLTQDSISSFFIDKGANQNSKMLFSCRKNNLHETSTSSAVGCSVEEKHPQDFAAVEFLDIGASFEPLNVTSEGTKESCLNGSNLATTGKINRASSYEIFVTAPEDEQVIENPHSRDSKKAHTSLEKFEFLEENDLHSSGDTRSLELTKCVSYKDGKEGADISAVENQETSCRFASCNSEPSQFASLVPECVNNTIMASNGKCESLAFPVVFPLTAMCPLSNSLPSLTPIRYCVNSTESFSGTSMVLSADGERSAFEDVISLMSKKIKENATEKRFSMLAGSHSHSLSSSSVITGCEATRHPLTPPIRKLASTSGKSCVSFDTIGPNPELVCFRIDEDSSIEEQKDHVIESSKDRLKPRVSKDSAKRKILGDVSSLYKNAATLVSGPKNNQENSTVVSLSLTSSNGKQTNSDLCHLEKNTSEGIFIAATANKENHLFFPSVDKVRKAAESLCCGSSKTTVSEEGKETVVEEAVIPKGVKLNNIVSNISSFIPLVRQKQQADLHTVRRGFNVKALKAAEAAKRNQEKKKNEREMRKAEIWKKKADNAAKKRQREDEEKKEKERKRRCVEETKKTQKQLGRGVHVGKEKQQKIEIKDQEVVNDGRKCKEFETVKCSTECKNPSHTEQESQVISAADDARYRSCVKKSHSLIKDSSNLEKVEFKVEDVKKNTQDRMSSTESQEFASYQISPYKDSDDEDEENDVRRNRKPIASWARKENLHGILVSNKSLNPDDIFSRKASFDLSTVLSPESLRERL